MAVTDATIAHTLALYLRRWPDESDSLEPLRSALIAHGSLGSKKNFQWGHVTAGAAVVNPDGEVLIVFNKALGKWLLPGGHLEREDYSLEDAALRELCEETGITRQGVRRQLDSLCPVDIGIHTIPTNTRRGDPSHFHADFRYGFLVDKVDVTIQREEIADYRWHPLDDEIIAGLAKKVRRSIEALSEVDKRPN
ncbi:NUDIX hydrolase [Mycolicibacterium peregrinum]|uniref:NUDIX hydrolase n=1 Tax=Mycolicibacterium peregrinum TaxID=43304 RepID=UPI003AB0DD9A